MLMRAAATLNKNMEADEPSKRFKLGSKIGAGAFATIFSATDLQTNRKIAIKRLGKNKKGVLPTDEYMVSKDLKHPNVIRTLDCVCSDKEMFLAVELLSGGDLFAKLDPNGPGLDEKTARRFMSQMADGLAYIHANNIVHADIKPENVLIHNGAIKICDFGLAAPQGTERIGSSKGTGAYMSPQLVNRKNNAIPYHLDTSQDVWSFGIVLYAVLFADLPWEKARPTDADFALFCRLGGVSPRVHPFQHVSAPMRKFFRLLLAFNPKKRPTMAQCVEFLKTSTPWYSTSDTKRASISFGMKENKKYNKVQYSKDSIDSDTSDMSVGSLPSINEVSDGYTSNGYLL
eukprot:m.180849 g.180849  ORF g.180849 m.180849 type:complete len:344 (+) comp15120_c0_seq1:157-1188(+)